MSTPTGWRPTTIGELGRYLNGRAFRSSEWGDVGRPIVRIQNLTGSGKTFNYFDGDVEDRYIVRRGDLLVSWAATLGAYFWTGPEAVLNQHIFKVASSIDTRFHKYLLDYKLAELQRSTHGSGMVHITRGRFDAVKVAVPALGEQRRIVQILEDHLSRIDAGLRALTDARRRASSFAASTMAALVATASGDEKSTIGSEAQLVEYGSSAKAHVQPVQGDLPVLRMGNIRDARISWDPLKYLHEDHADVPRLLLAPGDLLFNRTNSAELVGKSAVFDGRQPATFASYLIRVRLKDRVLPEWANIVINSPQGRHYIASVVSQQVGQANVNGTKLRAFPLPVPSLEDQARAREAMSVAWDTADRLRVSTEKAAARAASLRQSLLTAAFSGRLTGAASDFDRTEELAAAL